MERRKDDVGPIDPLSDLYVEQESGESMVSTRLVSTGGTSRSLRTTVPQWVVEHFSLTPGDEVNWALQVEDGEMRLVVTPKKE